MTGSEGEIFMIKRFHTSTLLVSLMTLFACATAACGGGSDGPPSKLSSAFQDAIHRNCNKLFACKSSYLPAMHQNATFEDFAGGATADACFNTVKTFILAGAGQDFFTK